MTDKPRCPLRMAGFDQPDTCDERCAKLVHVWKIIDCEEEEYIGLVCADATVALNRMDYYISPANVMEVNE